jgi:hypothetical protein
MKNKIVIIILSVLLVISVAYGTIATIAATEFSAENNLVNYDEERKVGATYIALCEIDATGYKTREVSGNKIKFYYEDKHTIEASLTCVDDEYYIVSLSDGNGNYYWLDETVKSYGDIIEWE